MLINAFILTTGECTEMHFKQPAKKFLLHAWILSANNNEALHFGGNLSNHFEQFFFVFAFANDVFTTGAQNLYIHASSRKQLFSPLSLTCGNVYRVSGNEICSTYLLLMFLTSRRFRQVVYFCKSLGGLVSSGYLRLFEWKCEIVIVSTLDRELVYDKAELACEEGAGTIQKSARNALDCGQSWENKVQSSAPVSKSDACPAPDFRPSFKSSEKETWSLNAGGVFLCEFSPGLANPMDVTFFYSDDDDDEDDESSYNIKSWLDARGRLQPWLEPDTKFWLW